MEEHPEKEDEYLELFVRIQLTILSKNVPLLSLIKDKFKRKLNNAQNINDNITGKNFWIRVIFGRQHHRKIL